MNADQITRLTDSQRAYLRLVLEHLSSKEIAQKFGISAHTIDKRIKEAMRILGVRSRIEAAKMLAQAEDRELLSKSPAPAMSGKVSPDIGPAIGDVPAPGEAVGAGRGPSLPYPLFSRPHHDLSVLQRAGWMIGLTIGLAVATGVLLSGLTALSTLLMALYH